jgi:hypothetical protein
LRRSWTAESANISRIAAGHPASAAAGVVTRAIRLPSPAGLAQSVEHNGRNPRRGATERVRTYNVGRRAATNGSCFVERIARLFHAFDLTERRGAVPCISASMPPIAETVFRGGRVSLK